MLTYNNKSKPFVALGRWCVGGLFCLLSVVPSHAGFVDEVETVVDDYMAERQASSVLPGATVAIVKDGEIILLKGYGHADLEKQIPADPERTLFPIGSVGKTVTGIAVMQLVEKGLLDLDTDVNQYLSHFQIPDTFPQPVTLRALLSHRTGFEDLPYRGFMYRDPEKVPTLEAYLASHIPKRVFPPGQVSAYSNYGLALAGYIVQETTGTDFATYVEEKIFTPLAMENSTYREPFQPGHPYAMEPALAANIATGYHKGPNGEPVPQPFVHISHIAPAGSMISTAADMANYMLALLNNDSFQGNRLLSPATSRAMDNRLYNDRPLAVDLAHAFFDGQFQGHAFKAHSGGTPTFKTNMTLYTDLGLGVFITVNGDDNGSRVADELHQALVTQFFPADEAVFSAEPPADAHNRWQAYTGLYQRVTRSFTKVDKLLQASHQEVIIDDAGYLAIGSGSQAGRYVAVDDGVFRLVEGDIEDALHLPQEYIYFKDNNSGKPTLLTMPVNDARRISVFETRSFILLPVALVALLSLVTLATSWTRKVRASTLYMTDHIVRWTLVALSAAIVVNVLAMIPVVTNPSSTGELIFQWPGRLLPLLYGILVLAGLSLIATVMLVPLWVKSGFGWMRRGFFTLFTLACLLTVVVLWQWNLVGLNY